MVWAEETAWRFIGQFSHLLQDFGPGWRVVSSANPYSARRNRQRVVQSQRLDRCATARSQPKDASGINAPITLDPVEPFRGLAVFATEPGPTFDLLSQGFRNRRACHRRWPRARFDRGFRGLAAPESPAPGRDGAPRSGNPPVTLPARPLPLRSTRAPRLRG